MSTAPQVRFDASVWRLPQATEVAGGSAPRADFAARRWRAPAIQRQQDARVQRLGGQTMGTTWSLQLPNTEFLPLGPVQVLIESALDEVIAQMSNWERGSVISRFNDAAAGSWHDLPAEFVQVLGAAMHWAERSGGALDPTMGALVSLWGFGPRTEPLAPHSGERPSAERIEALRATSGHGRIAWRDGDTRLRQPGGLRLDLCGIAKGFAVDQVARKLQDAGWSGGLFEIGGELRSWGGKPGGGAWQIQLGSQGDATSEPLVVAVKNGAFATSGDWWHHFFADGRRYSHTLDPRTGWPVTHALASVTVHHDECMHADALATVLTVLGPDQGMAFADANNVAAVFQEHDAAPCMSAAWKARFAS
ncbi:FAD:protein FMN transferase [Diaphorobacter caeni]|uniref:FAD:protein FMN transferase n=1 Tax=Diaphorobacter caeni TaxID=2784387 RepID=UPI00188EE55D|nr:FAD:protein FMN transferase [Diaphorobacter caeni]MBF5004282.1 FAD:protein FMN transferase [Diaphorobacter caeni]